MVTADLSAGTEGDACVPCTTTQLGTMANTHTSSLSNTGAIATNTCAGCHDLPYPGAGDYGRTNTDATCTT